VISGAVTEASGVGVSGVEMSGLPGNPQTSASGNYSATVSYGWSGTVTPIIEGYTFDPSSREYTNVTTNQTGQHYTATAVTSPEGVARVQVKAGGVYILEFEKQVDSEPIGMQWGQEGLPICESILSPLCRKTIMLKADDLKTPLHPSWYRYFELCDGEDIPCTAGIICDSLQNADSETKEYLTSLHPYKVEFWHHGWDHYKGSSEVREFRGTTLEYQINHLQWGLDEADNIGIDMHSFGAPFNAVDDNTITALSFFPEISSIFYQPTVPGKTTFYRNLNLESSPGQIYSLEEFKQLYTEQAWREVLALQLHPLEFSEEEWTRLSSILRFLAEENRRFTTPTGYVNLQEDLYYDNIVVKKTGDKVYTLDLSNALHDHELEINQKPSKVTASPTIAGMVRDASGTGIGGVILTFSGGAGIATSGVNG
jgi:hypothetical protein